MIIVIITTIMTFQKKSKEARTDHATWNGQPPFKQFVEER